MLLCPKTMTSSLFINSNSFYTASYSNYEMRYFCKKDKRLTKMFINLMVVTNIWNFYVSGVRSACYIGHFEKGNQRLTPVHNSLC